jgi:hypothetical protein
MELLQLQVLAAVLPRYVQTPQLGLHSIPAQDTPSTDVL